MNLREKYTKEAVPAMKEKFGYKNTLSVPQIEKVVLNVGIGKSKDDSRMKDIVLENMTLVSGQKPVLTKARKSISNFKVREGAPVGVKVTLRSKRMYDFLDKLVGITMPRIRDFQGLDTKIVDKAGNLNLGFKDQVPFPEMTESNIEKLHGVQVTITTSAKTHEEGVELFKLLGFPFKK